MCTERTQDSLERIALRYQFVSIITISDARRANRADPMNSAALPSADLAWSSPATPRGSSLAGKAYWAMVRRLVLTAACIDVGYIALFMWLGSWPLTLVNVGSIALYLTAYALIRHRKMPGGSL